MFHVLPEPMSPDKVLAWREGEREHILAYGAVLARERAALAAVVAWRELHGRCRGRMADANSFDAERLHQALKDAEAEAIEAHQAAVAELRRIVTPFTILGDSMLRFAK
jgi:uncharacterized heparinase superfamily protein